MAKQQSGGYYNLRSGLVIYPKQQEEIDQYLIELAQRLPANFLLLTDVTGQIVSSRGGENSSNLVALGSLVAGDLAASQEIARLTNQYQEHQMILREGSTTHTFITEAGSYLALLAQVSNEVPLGWARMLIQEAARKLVKITSESIEEADAPPESFDFGLEEDELSDLFSDALDEMWKE